MVQSLIQLPQKHRPRLRAGFRVRVAIRLPWFSTFLTSRIFVRGLAFNSLQSNILLKEMASLFQYIQVVVKTIYSVDCVTRPVHLATSYGVLHITCHYESKHTPYCESRVISKPLQALNLASQIDKGTH